MTGIISLKMHNINTLIYIYTLDSLRNPLGNIILMLLFREEYNILISTFCYIKSLDDFKKKNLYSACADVP